MKKTNLPVGISDFEKIRRDDFYYIDKSGLISDLLQSSGAAVTLITRPRRFGKTLAMSMLASFFDIRRDSHALFSDLKVASDPALCEKWQNQFPTIFFTMKDIDGLTFSSAFSQLSAQIANLCKEHTYLLDCDQIDPDDKVIFQQLKAARGDEVQISRALSTLMRMMHQYYSKPVILLLDEYDVPLAKASSHGYYAQMLELVKVMMSTALKDNPDLMFAVVTGCLKIAKESIFTGVNNLVSDTISSSHLDEYFGFTQDDVTKMLRDMDAQSYASSIREWYDGYHFGAIEVYCPWDVMNYLRDLQYDPAAKPASYWKNTSDNAIIRSFLDIAGTDITRKLEALLSGTPIIQQIDENLTYDYLHSSEENLWSILYLTGYLTKVRDSELTAPLPDGMSAFQIPNAEIREIFQTTILKWFQDNAKTWDRKLLFDAVWSGNCETLTQEINRLLRRTISYHDYREDFYHAFLAGIFAGAGYPVESNKEHGEGRSDIVVYDPIGGQAAIFEAKYSRSQEHLDADCDAALRQIDTRAYAADFEEYDHVFCYGISFFRKRCLVKIQNTITNDLI